MFFNIFVKHSENLRKSVNNSFQECGSINNSLLSLDRLLFTWLALCYKLM